MTVKKHHVVKFPHMRQLRLAPHHALHVTSIIENLICETISMVKHGQLNMRDSYYYYVTLLVWWWQELVN